MDERIEAGPSHRTGDILLACIYIGCRYRNDTVHLGKLFELYTKAAVTAPLAKSKKRRAGANT
jgi:hypothetical protein